MSTGPLGPLRTEDDVKPRTIERSSHPTTSVLPRGPAVVRLCERCGSQFAVDRWRIRRGEGKFCSVRCTARSQTRLKNITARSFAMLAARRENRTLLDIGREWGVSRERVRQIVDRTAAKLQLSSSPRCAKCGRLRASAKAPCLSCETVRATVKACRKCQQSFRSSHGTLYCDECRFGTHPCGSCGKLITRDRGRQADEFRNLHWFCNKQCQGRWLGKNYGKNGLLRRVSAREADLLATVLP